MCGVALNGWAQQRSVVARPDAFVERPRVLVISDIGNEPDDQMSLLRLLLYSNEMEIEGLVAATSTWQKTATHAETMHELVKAYGEVRGNLQQHASGWPEAAALDGVIATGQPGYGMAATGAGKDSAGAAEIVRAVDREDARPLWISIWGGANTLAQALISVRATRSPEQVKTFVSKLRVMSISDQDDAGPWIRREFPELFYVVQPSNPDGSSYAYATWTGISGDAYYRNGGPTAVAQPHACEGADTSVVTNEWLDANVRSKGSYGKHYPRFLFIMEGDTSAYLNLIGNGLNGYQRPDWGGWGGRYLYLRPYGETHAIWTQGGDSFSRVTSSDTVVGVDGREHTSDQATVWRWRDAFQNDFAARMDWTVKDFAHANHEPELVVNGVAGHETMELDAAVGQPLVLDAAGSHDRDAGQTLRYAWFEYGEAGAASGSPAVVRLEGADTSRVTVTPVSACTATWLPKLMPCQGDGDAHIILAVTDDGTPALTSYRRVVVHVKERPAD